MERKRGKKLFKTRNFKSQKEKKAQAGIEYMIIVGFVTFAIMSVLVLAMLYSGQIRDKVKVNQVESFATQLINSAESVFFAGEPSKTTISLYLPEDVTNITINSNQMVITITTSSGENVRAFESKVPIQGTITISEGIKRLTLEATENYLLISQ